VKRQNNYFFVEFTSFQILLTIYLSGIYYLMERVKGREKARSKRKREAEARGQSDVFQRKLNFPDLRK